MARQKILSPIVLVGALGYFVDIYDLVLFSILRTASLKGLGVPDEKLLDVGVTLLNWQMSGLLIGGIVWGILGDKRGRLSVLFGSILLYSLANIANSFVHTVEQYAALRFIAGIGLAGELGAAITLVAEVLPKEVRGYGTAVVAGVGLSGAVFAGIIADFLDWKAAYFTGGVLGLCLLFARVRLAESGMFSEARASSVSRGDVRLLFAKASRAWRYVCCILIGIPIWYCVGILVTFAPEIAKSLGAVEPVSAGRGILWCYAGIAIGDLGAGILSQWMGSRKKVVAGAMALEAVLVGVLLFSHGFTAAYYYVICFLLGIVTGYWAVFVTMASEQFGTNLRATVTTTVPNFVRGSVVLLTLAFRGMQEPLGLAGSALAVFAGSLVLALVALSSLDETHSRDLNYLET
jgi:MFS transporter, putative metabolite:H+ symporter